MKSIHHNAKPSSHWFSIIFVVLFIVMASDAFDSSLDATVQYNNYAHDTDAEIERQMGDVPAAGSAPTQMAVQTKTEPAGRFNRPYPEQAGWKEKAGYAVEFAYFHVVRSTKKLWHILTRTLQRIEASINVGQVH